MMGRNPAAVSFNGGQQGGGKKSDRTEQQKDHGVCTFYLEVATKNARLDESDERTNHGDRSQYAHPGQRARHACDQQHATENDLNEGQGLSVIETRNLEDRLVERTVEVGAGQRDETHDENYSAGNGAHDTCSVESLATADNSRVIGSVGAYGDNLWGRGNRYNLWGRRGGHNLWGRRYGKRPT